MRISILPYIVLIATIFSLSPVVAQSVTVSPVLKAYPKKLSSRLEQFDKRAAQVGLAGLGRGAAASIKLWNPKTYNKSNPIVACFFGGTKGLRKQVRKVAMRWTKVRGARVPLKFQSGLCRGGEHIRIAFCNRDDEGQPAHCEDGEYAGRWSLVGKHSANFQSVATRGRPSMNLQGINIAGFSYKQKVGIVLHEIGHALGFEHEHQNPFAKCDNELNWRVIRKTFSGKPHYWSRKRIDYGFKDLFRQGTLLRDSQVIAEDDPNTVMSYELRENFFKRGRKSPCYRRAHFSISKVDKQLLREMYPSSKAAQEKLKQDRLKRILPKLKRGLRNLPPDLKFYLDE